MEKKIYIKNSPMGQRSKEEIINEGKLYKLTAKKRIEACRGELRALMKKYPDNKDVRDIVYNMMRNLDRQMAEVYKYNGLCDKLSHLYYMSEQRRNMKNLGTSQGQVKELELEYAVLEHSLQGILEGIANELDFSPETDKMPRFAAYTVSFGISDPHLTSAEWVKDVTVLSMKAEKILSELAVKEMRGFEIDGIESQRRTFRDQLMSQLAYLTALKAEQTALIKQNPGDERIKAVAEGQIEDLNLQIRMIRSMAKKMDAWIKAENNYIKEITAIQAEFESAGRVYESLDNQSRLMQGIPVAGEGIRAISLRSAGERAPENGSEVHRVSITRVIPSVTDMQMDKKMRELSVKVEGLLSESVLGGTIHSCEVELDPSYKIPEKKLELSQEVLEEDVPTGTMEEYMEAIHNVGEAVRMEKSDSAEHAAMDMSGEVEAAKKNVTGRHKESSLGE